MRKPPSHGVVCLGGPQDGAFFLSAGCEVDHFYPMYSQEQMKPVNVPIYQLKWVKRLGYRFVFSGYENDKKPGGNVATQGESA